MTINKRALLALGAALAVPQLASAQAKPPAKAASTEDIVFGASVPLTGVFAFAGIAIDQGIKDYLSILNEGGGIKGRKLRYVAEDTGYKVDQSMAVFKRITSQNKVSLYYADSTGFVKTVNPELERAQSILMTGASFGKEISDAQKYPLQSWSGPTTARWSASCCSTSRRPSPARRWYSCTPTPSSAATRWRPRAPTSRRWAWCWRPRS